VTKPEDAFPFLPFVAGVEIRYLRIESLVHGHKTLKLRTSTFSLCKVYILSVKLYNDSGTKLLLYNTIKPR
jgi:hypothetical protein